MLIQRRSRIVGPLTVCVVAAAALAGCSGGVTLNDVGDVVLVTDAGFLTGDDPSIQGTVAVTDARCIGITDTTQGATYPTVWPRGTSLVDGAGITIAISGVGVRRLGDQVDGAGGYYGVGKRPVLDEVADRCAWEGEVIGVRFG
ncbi:hypothetical protein BW733_00350 [Tessaracoccus flavescens]|uniref:Lipoprotein n=1 Tax=Tessaracoccus flavescens TaxID=399497 RepID=A0A1Q2CTT9_9ACTN|nr:hypothetical protein BW733_00350 [Tessaracoccus flavescens]